MFSSLWAMLRQMDPRAITITSKHISRLERLWLLIQLKLLIAHESLYPSLNSPKVTMLPDIASKPTVCKTLSLWTQTSWISHALQLKTITPLSLTGAWMTNWCSTIAPSRLELNPDLDPSPRQVHYLSRIREMSLLAQRRNICSLMPASPIKAIENHSLSRKLQAKRC